MLVVIAKLLNLHMLVTSFRDKTDMGRTHSCLWKIIHLGKKVVGLEPKFSRGKFKMGGVP